MRGDPQRREKSSLRERLNVAYVSQRERRRSLRDKGFSSYSQFGEDAIVRALINDWSGGYVDIGSGHPVRFSNTYALYRKGVRGLLVEPIAANVEHARLVRPEDMVVQSLCGPDQRAVPFFEYEQYEYSTTSRERVDELASRGFRPVSEYQIDVRSLASLVADADIFVPELLSIDVEGAELAVLESADWDRFRPAVIVGEEWTSPLDHVTAVSTYLTRLEYELVAVTGFSSVYRSKV